jgi:hypothetical protein
MAMQVLVLRLSARRCLLPLPPKQALLNLVASPSEIVALIDNWLLKL